MRKNIKRIVDVTLFAFIILLYLLVLPSIRDGYYLYLEAKNSMNLEDKIEWIQMNPDYITLDEVPDIYIKELLISEDKRFYYHIGMDPIAILRAAVIDVKLGYFAQGGSTITQQLAKNFYFSFEKTYVRKIAELFMAFDLEDVYTKDEILELYINISYFGENCYGLKSAARYYFGVSPENLTEIQRASLIWTIKSPNNYNPNVFDQDKLYDTIMKKLHKKSVFRVLS